MQQQRSYPTLSCETDALRLDAQLCFPLYACAKEVVRRYKPLLDDLGITYTQYLVLMALWEEDRLTVGELGARLYLDSGTLTPLLKKMEAADILSRTRDPHDERRVVVVLSQKGKGLQKRAVGVPSQIASCVSLEPEEALQLWTLLYKVLDGFAAADEEEAG